VSHRTAICVVTGRATLVVNSASDYASGSLEPPLGSFDAAKGLTSSVCGSTFGLHQTTASVLSSLLPGYQTGSSQTGCDCLAAHGSYSLWFTPCCLPLQTEELRQDVYHWATMSGASPRTPLGPHLGSRLLCFPTSTDRMHYRIPSDHAPGHQLVSMHPVGIHGRLVRPHAAEAITD
jgi:hypothetical protein